MKKNLILLIFCIYLPISLSGQNTAKRLQYGISLSITPWSLFYDDKYEASYDLWKGVGLSPVLDVVALYNMGKRKYVSIDLSNMQKYSETKGGIPYDLKYITVSTLAGLGLKQGNTAQMILSIGPYLGYIYSAKKGRFNVLNEDLNKWEAGIEISYNYLNKTKWKYSPFGFQTIKLQVGLNEVVYFKTLSFTISLIGYKF